MNREWAESQKLTGSQVHEFAACCRWGWPGNGPLLTEGSCAQAVVSADRGRGSTGSLPAHSDVSGVAVLWGACPRAGRISQRVQFPVCRQGTERTCPGLLPLCKCPRTPHPQCSLHVRHCSAPLAQHRLPELKYLLTHTGSLWTRLGSAPKTKEKNPKKGDHRAPGTEEDDSELQRAWGALIKEKEQSRQKKSRLDNLPSLQIEVSRESSSGSDAES